MEKRDLYNRYKENTKFTILKEQETPDNYYTLVVTVLIQEIDKANSIVVLTHENPDGDAIGTGLALYNALKLYGKNPDIIIPEYPRIFEFLPGISEIKEELGMEAKPQELQLMYSTRDDINRCFYDLYYLIGFVVGNIIYVQISNNKYSKEKLKILLSFNSNMSLDKILYSFDIDVNNIEQLKLILNKINLDYRTLIS